ncbi:hypothetical protein [Solidesulfovibrio sp.]
MTKIKKVIEFLTLPAIMTCAFLLPTALQDKQAIVEKSSKHKKQIVSCYTEHYRAILNFAFERYGFKNKSLEDCLFIQRYGHADALLPNTSKYFRAVLESPIPPKDAFCQLCYAYRLTYSECINVYDAVVYIESNDPPRSDCVRDEPYRFEP